MHVRSILGAALGLTLGYFGLAPDAPSPSAHATDAPSFSAAAPAFADRDLSAKIGALKNALGASRDQAAWLREARMAVWDFTRQMQAGRLTAGQEKSVITELDALTNQYPVAAASLAQARRTITTLTIGKTAPEIVGTDLDGRPLRLSAYRGRVVVLAFTANWCGICRSEYSTDRALIERFGGAGFAFLGVNSDPDPAVARRLYRENGLNFPAFWDGAHGGPIANAWEVVGWPTVYVLDAQGVIRFVDLRQQDLVKSVGDVLAEPAAPR